MKRRGGKVLEDTLDQNLSCYVLITCGQSGKDGNMQVEMSYRGDAALASYLIQGAQSFLDKEEDDAR